MEDPMNGRLAARWLRLVIVSGVWTVALAGVGARGADGPEGRKAIPSAVPDAASIATAEATVSELFSTELAEKGVAGRLALSLRFRAQAATGADEAAVRYVLLRRACDLAAEAG